jgi:hypothetical protein
MKRNIYISKVFILLLIASCISFGQSQKKEKMHSTGIAPYSINDLTEKSPTLMGSFYSPKFGYLEEGFEGVEFPPAGWTSTNVKGSEVWERSTDDFNSGIASAFIDYDYPEGEDWLITPQIYIQSGATITFYLARQFSSNYPPDYLYVYVSTTDNNLSSFTLSNQIFAIDINSLTPDIFTQFAYDLTAYSGQNVYIAFQHVDADGNGCYLDDIKIGTPPNNDVGILSIDIPNFVPPGNYLPKVTVKNFGLNNATFDVTLLIGNNYSSTKTVSNAVSGSVQTITFDAINFTVGTYSVEANTVLIGNQDENPSNNSAGKTVVCQAMETIYGFNAYGGVPVGTVNFDAGNPGVINAMFPFSQNFLAGSAHTPQGNFGIYYSSNEFMKWNMNTGELTTLAVLVPPLGEWTGMTYDPITQKLYAVCATTSASVLCEIDIYTYQVTNIATLNNILVIGIACNGDGNIYGVDIINDVFGKYNIATNTFSQISSLGFDANYAQSLEFNYENNKLYYAGYISSGLFMLIDHLTGAITSIGPFQGGAEIDGIFYDGGGEVPVELTSFEAKKIDNKIYLNWSTATETNNDRFEIYKRYADTDEWMLLGTVKGKGTTTEFSTYEFVDNDIYKLNTYYYQLKQIDYDGSFEYSKIISVNNNQLPSNFILKQNYPNPFNPNTVIEYSIPKNCMVELAVYDVLGNLVDLIETGYKEAGNYKNVFNAQKLSSGVYYYQLKADNFIEVKKMMILK